MSQEGTTYPSPEIKVATFPAIRYHHQRTQTYRPEETPGLQTRHSSSSKAFSPTTSESGYALVPCRLGSALLRIMHLVVSIRQRNPTTPIYTQKVDWSKAYRRKHYSASAALECATQCGDLLIVSIRLTFGDASNASRFCNCNEIVCDIQELHHCEDWDPDEVYSPIQDQIPSTRLTMNSSTLSPKPLARSRRPPTTSVA
jgi:hypothetical protein